MARRGFTLIELLVVIAILAILAGLVVGMVGYCRRAAEEANTEARIDAIRLEIVDHVVRKGSVPPDLAAVVPGLDRPQWLENGVLVDVWSRPLRYRGSGKAFRLWSAGADGADGTPDDLVFERR
jgi:general secretion pathway protein G